MWEVFCIINAVRRVYKLKPLTKHFEFEPADVVGVRLPEFNQDTSGDMNVIPESSALHMLQMKRKSVLRNVHNARFPNFPWDGPLLKVSMGSFSFTQSNIGIDGSGAGGGPLLSGGAGGLGRS